MSDLHRVPTFPKARKKHLCTSCYYPITVGESYVVQTGFWEGKAYRNKYHNECWEVLSEEPIFEFSPGSGDPPERLK